LIRLTPLCIGKRYILTTYAFRNTGSIYSLTKIWRRHVNDTESGIKPLAEILVVL
jgi:hypothetical protein